MGAERIATSKIIRNGHGQKQDAEQAEDADQASRRSVTSEEVDQLNPGDDEEEDVEQDNRKEDHEEEWEEEEEEGKGKGKEKEKHKQEKGNIKQDFPEDNPSGMIGEALINLKDDSVLFPVGAASPLTSAVCDCKFAYLRVYSSVFRYLLSN